jgi:outer membrane biosynthesis protein TonB
MVARARDGTAEEAEPTEAKPGPEGGATPPLEMARIDLPKQRETFADALDVRDEASPAPDTEDAMPERAPVVDATEPWFQMPRVRPGAPLVAKPLARPESPPAVNAPPGARPSPETMGQADLAAFSPERRLNTMNGSLSNQGKSGIDAEATPVGAYKAKVARAVERRWHELRTKNASFVSFGSLKVRFLVNRNGHVSGIRVVHQDAGAVLTDFSLAAIASAAIPPMPPEVADAFGSEPLEVTYDILIY